MKRNRHRSCRPADPRGPVAGTGRGCGRCGTAGVVRPNRRQRWRTNLHVDTASPGADDGADSAACDPADDDGLHASHHCVGHPAAGAGRRPDAAEPGADRTVAVPDFFHHDPGHRPHQRGCVQALFRRHDRGHRRARQGHRPAQEIHARSDPRKRHRHVRQDLRRQGFRDPAGCAP